MERPIQIPTTGKLDKDSDLQFIRSDQGDMPALLDMEFSESNVLTLTTAKGNVSKIDTGQVVKQNQIVRIFWDNVNQPTTVSVELKNVNGQTLGFGTRNFDGGLIQFKESIISIFQVDFIYAATFASTGTEAYIDCGLDVQFSDWELVITGATYKVLQEAISETGAGFYKPIGSFDLLGDQFYWLTTQRNLKSQINDVTDAVGNAFGRSVVRIPAHGLSDYDTIAINGAQGVTGVNGIWVVRVADNFHVELQASIFGGTYTGGGEVFKDIYGYGCIGVSEYNPTNDTFSFIPLLRSTQLNFVTKREIYNPQIQVEGELISMYYTDNYNLPRCTYYRGAYVADGCIEVVSPKGQYDYTTLSQEISLQSSYSGYELSFLEQKQTGGALYSGNKRYAIHFVTEGGNTTQLSLLTGPIPVFEPQYDLPSSVVYGTQNTSQTGKINRLSLTGITPGVFEFVELICFEYQGGPLQTVAVNAIIVRRESLSSDQTEIVLEHNGSEIGVVNFDAGLANQVQPDIITARDLTLIQNRCVLGNIRTSWNLDIRNWIAQFTYSIKRFSVYGSYGAETFYEFYSPEATVNRTGYRQWEWERFYAVPELLSGTLGQAFFAFDVRFVSQSDYVGEYGPNEFLATNGGDRRDITNDDFVDYDLMQNTREYLQYYLQVNNVDWEFQINGVPAKNLFRSVKIFRADTIPEVLATGAIQLGQRNATDSPSGQVDFLTPFYDNTVAAGQPTPFWGATTYPQIGTSLRNRSIGSFYGPDFLFDGTEEISGSAQLLVAGNYKVTPNGSQFASQNFPVPSYQRIYSSEDMASSVDVYEIDASPFINSGETATVGVWQYTKTLESPGSTVNNSYTGDNPGSLVFGLNTAVQNNSSNTDYGFYQAIVFRRRLAKYGDQFANNVVIFTGCTIARLETSGEVFGGDIFTQQTWLKNRVPLDQTLPGPVGFLLGGAGYNIISQNRVNTNLRVYVPTDINQLIYPVSTRDIAPWLESTLQDTIVQNSSYKVINQVQAQVVYDPNGQDDGAYNTRVYYSEAKPNGSRVDYMRTILPLNFQDQPQVYGPISRVMNLNNDLFITLERGLIQSYFNSRGQLVSPDQGQILIGDGSVMSRIGLNLTQYGTDNSGAVMIGKSQSGKDVLYVLCPVYGEFLRFGDDGLVSVSRREKMRTFFNENMKWAIDAKTPADGYGITSVWDDSNKQAIFTVKAWKQVQQWATGVFYNAGAEVISGTAEQGVPQIWIATGTSQSERPGEGPNWEAVALTNNSYYNAFTFTWSELKGGFTQFYSFLPNHYTEWNNTYLSAQPDLDSDDSGIIYQHSIGAPAQYYGVNYFGGQPSIVSNWQKDLNKKFFALMLNSNRKPEYVGVSALFRNEPDGEFEKLSYLEETDFETREGGQYSPVKLEIGPNGTNDEDTGMIEGLWCRFDVRFPKGEVSTLTDFVVHLRDSKRNFLR